MGIKLKSKKGAAKKAAAEKSTKKSPAVKKVKAEKTEKRSGNFLHEPSKSALKEFAKFKTLDEKAKAAVQEAKDFCATLPAAFDMDKGFSFVDADGEFRTIMSKTTADGVIWFLRAAPQFTDANPPGRKAAAKPAKKAAKAEKPAKGKKVKTEKKAAKTEKPAKSKKGGKAKVKKAKAEEAPAEAELGASSGQEVRPEEVRSALGDSNVARVCAGQELERHQVLCREKGSRLQHEQGGLSLGVEARGVVQQVQDASVLEPVPALSAQARIHQQRVRRHL